MTETADTCHLAAVRTHLCRLKAFPPKSKVAGTLGLSSSGSVFAVGRLTESGFLERVEVRIAMTRKFFSYPVIGRVCAGLPQPTSKDSFEMLNSEDVLARDSTTAECAVVERALASKCASSKSTRQLGVLSRSTSNFGGWAARLS